MSFRSFFSSSVRPTAYSAFGLSTTSTLSRPISSSIGSARCSKFLVRPPSELAPRECPTPVVLLNAKGLKSTEFAQGEEEESWASWAGMFAERGYTAVEVDIQPPPAPTIRSSSSSGATSGGSGFADENAQDETNPNNFNPPGSNILSSMSSELAHQIRLLAIPFPPILITSQSSALLAQTYISDNPASGLVLIAPPNGNSFTVSSSSDPSSNMGTSTNMHADAGGKELQTPEFNYEPHFPILVVAPSSMTESLQQGNRLVRDYEHKGVGRGGKGVTVELAETEELKSDANRYLVERWMDSCGF